MGPNGVSTAICLGSRLFWLTQVPFLKSDPQAFYGASTSAHVLTHKPGHCVRRGFRAFGVRACGCGC